MNIDLAVKSLNMTDGEVLTLEKAKSRMEFEALPLMVAAHLPEAASTRCGTYSDPDDPCPDDDPLDYKGS
ncbi:MAG: hypothetical protein A2X31_09635 [Elusimicrobia bacterium GWB2_63_22]|nr:MAG: hypothetical protein A2X31_09635 [Elusimicrobia bacterium GWB2_63_22]